MNKSDPEAYIASAPEERVEGLSAIRKMVKKHCKSYTESMAYGMPTYDQDGEIIFAFASQKNYMAFYACHYDLLEALPEVTDKYNCGKSCIRFKKADKELIRDLEKVVKHIKKNVKESQYYGKMRVKSK